MNTIGVHENRITGGVNQEERCRFSQDLYEVAQDQDSGGMTELISNTLRSALLSQGDVERRGEKNIQTWSIENICCEVEKKIKNEAG